MNYSRALDFDMTFLPLGYWDYNPEFGDLTLDELEGELDIEDKVCYNVSRVEEVEERTFA